MPDSLFPPGLHKMITGRLKIAKTPATLPKPKADLAETEAWIDRPNVRCNELMIGPESVLFGPAENALAGTGRATGSFQTSALAIGLSKSAIDFIGVEAEKREDLVDNHAALSQQLAEIESRVLQLASGVRKLSSF